MELKNIERKANQRNPNTRISYFQLRQLIGISGIILPVFCMLFAEVVEPSISLYYYSISHIIFVGTMSALCAFLITYKGTYRLENWLSNIAGVAAACVAIFPTNFANYIGEAFLHLPTYWETSKLINFLHYASASVLFICFAIICYWIFPKPDENQPIDDKKRKRNKIYKTCGVIMMISIFSILFFTIFKSLDFPHSTLVFETTTLIPFSISWLLKGSYHWKTSKNPLLRNSVKGLR